MQPLLEMKHIRKTFSSTVALGDVSLNVYPGEVRGLIGENEWVERDKIEYRHFAPWVEFAKENGFGIDFNPTIFSHKNMKDGLSLSSPDENIRNFWIDHAKACRKIA